MTKAEVNLALIRLGGTPGSVGFGYLVDCVLILDDEPDMALGVDTFLYPRLARISGRSVHGVDTTIRAEIDRIYANHDNGYAILPEELLLLRRGQARPPVRRFIVGLTMYLQYTLKKEDEE